MSTYLGIYIKAIPKKVEEKSYNHQKCSEGHTNNYSANFCQECGQKIITLSSIDKVDHTYFNMLNDGTIPEVYEDMVYKPEYLDDEILIPNNNIYGVELYKGGAYSIYQNYSIHSIRTFKDEYSDFLEVLDSAYKSYEVLYGVVYYHD